MSRSRKKGPFIDKSVVVAVMRTKASKKVAQIKTKSRRSTIIPEFVGITFLVYNGKIYIPVLITEGMIGHKLGEFSITRTFKGHKKS